MMLWRALSIHTEFHLRGLWNWRSIMYGDLLQPLIYLAFLATGLQNLIGEIDLQSGVKISYLAYVFAGLVALLTARVWPRTTFSVANERKWGMYALKRLNGFTVTKYLLAVILVEGILFLAQILLLLLLGLLLGLQISPLNLILAIVIGLFAVAFWAGIGTAVATFIHNYQQRELVISLTTLPMMFSAPIFFPLQNAPLYLKAFALVNPLTYQVNAIRHALFGVVNISDIGIAIAMTLMAGFFGRQCIDRSDLLSHEW